MDIKDMEVKIKINEEFMSGFNFGMKLMQMQTDGLHYTDNDRERVIYELLKHIETEL